MRLLNDLAMMSAVRCAALVSVTVMGSCSLRAQTTTARVELPRVVAPEMWSSSVDPEDVAMLPDGISLPRTGMVHALDQTTKGPVLVPLHAMEVVSNSHATGNFLRGQVLAGWSQGVEVKGLNAEVHLQSSTPSFLVRLTGDDPELLRGRVHLLRLQQTENRRLVARFSGNSFGGQHKKTIDDVPITKVDAEQDTWLKVTPTEPLPPGEYGIVFMPKDVRLAPDAVYDFDVAYVEAKPEK